MPQKKMTGQERQAYIIDKLKMALQPIPGRAFAEETNVSRQVIVQDVSLLKAKGEPILATSQGYVYMKEKTPLQKSRVIVCRHQPEETLQELYLIVDHGVRIHDVRVEHPVYGDLTGIVSVSNRQEADQFFQKVSESNAALLSELTEGVHLHTIEADQEEKLDAAEQALKRAGLLFE